MKSDSRAIRSSHFGDANSRPVQRDEDIAIVQMTERSAIP